MDRLTVSTATAFTLRCLLLRVRAAALLALFALAVPRLAAAAEQLRILAWPGYADPDVVAGFEKRTGAQVQVSYVNSDDELAQKLDRNNGADYDVFAVNTAELQRYIDRALAVPINLNAIPNHAKQLARFRAPEAIPGLVRDGKLYALPYTYSEMGLIYNRRQVREIPQSISVLWDPAYRGRVLAYNTSNHNFSLAALSMGVKNPFRLSPAELRQAARKLVQLRRNVRAFYASPEEAVKLYLDNDIAIVFANYGTQQLKALRAAGADVGYVIPREGALAWLDCWAVTRGAKDRALAERWINYTLTPEVSALLTSRQGLANTVTAFTDSRPDDRLIWLQPLQDFARREALWDRILSGDGADKF
jgi:putative spermidine/putrescine transport system substrate-binding protein